MPTEQLAVHQGDEKLFEGPGVIKTGRRGNLPTWSVSLRVDLVAEGLFFDRMGAEVTVSVEGAGRGQALVQHLSLGAGRVELTGTGPSPYEASPLS